MASGTPINLSYHTAALLPRRVGPAYLVSRLITSYIGYLLVMGVLTLLVPRFEVTFSNFKVNLPLATLFLIRVSRVCLDYYLWALLLPVPGIWAVANFNIPSRRQRRGIRVGAFVLVSAFLIFTILALVLPMLSLVNSASAQK